MKRISLAMLTAMSILCFSCREEDNNELATGKYVISTTVLNPDGMSGKSYLQLIPDLDKKEYGLEQALPIHFGTYPVVYDGNVYEPGSMSGDELKKFVISNGKILNTEVQTYGANTMPITFFPINEEKAYLSLWKGGKIIVLNPQNMKTIEEIDITKYGAVSNGDPNAGPMVMRDGIVYVSLSQEIGKNMPAPSRAKSDVLLIDEKTNKPIKMITSEVQGISNACRPADPKSMFIDENNDIYLVCIGAFGMMPGHNNGLLRIPNGSTEFDDYAFNLKETVVEGDGNKADWIQYCCYHNGKLYASANIPAYFGEKPNYGADRTVLPVEIDYKNKSIKSLGLPRGNSYNCLSVMGDFLYVGLSTDKTDGFFRYNVKTKEAEQDAYIKTQGAPVALYPL